MPLHQRVLNNGSFCAPARGKSHCVSVAGPGWGAGALHLSASLPSPLRLPASPVSQDKSLSALTSLSLCPFLQPPLLHPALGCVLPRPLARILVLQGFTCKSPPPTALFDASPARVSSSGMPQKFLSPFLLITIGRG